MIRTFEAHIIKMDKTSMDIKVHGGSVLKSQRRVKGWDYTTLLVVLMEPGSKQATKIMTKAEFNALTTDLTTHSEHVEIDNSTEPEYDTEPDWDCSLPAG